MRIISGKFKSRIIRFPKTTLTRPVIDRAKETIFNILGDRVPDTRVLDLYAGSGSLGLEALSRGAQFSIFVDHAPVCIKCIRDNLSGLGISHQGKTICSDIFAAIKSLQKAGEKVDLIFLDPPHNKGLIKKSLNLIDRSDILTPAGIIVVGHSNKEGIPGDLQHLTLQRSVKIGQTFVSYCAQKSYGNEQHET